MIKIFCDKCGSWYNDYCPHHEYYPNVRTTEEATQTDLVDEQHNDGRVEAGEQNFKYYREIIDDKEWIIQVPSNPCNA